MTEELTQALNLLKSDRTVTLAAVNHGENRIFTARGVKPLLELATDAPEFLEGASVADKVTGAASAFILVQGKVKELYTDVISQRAAEILEEHGFSSAMIPDYSGIFRVVTGTKTRQSE